MADANLRRPRSLTNEIADLLAPGQGSGRNRLRNKLGFVKVEASARNAAGTSSVTLALPPDSRYTEVVIERAPPGSSDMEDYAVWLSGGQGTGSVGAAVSRGKLADYLVEAELGEVSSRVQNNQPQPLHSGQDPTRLWSDVGQIHPEDLPPDVAAAAQSILPYSAVRQQCVEQATERVGPGVTYQQVLDAYRACVLGLTEETRAPAGKQERGRPWKTRRSWLKGCSGC